MLFMILSLAEPAYEILYEVGLGCSPLYKQSSIGILVPPPPKYHPYEGLLVYGGTSQA